MGKCPECQGELIEKDKNKNWQHNGTWSKCSRCAYPLNTAAVLGKLYDRLEDVEEFLLIPFGSSLREARALTLTEALAILKEFRESLSARYKGEDAIVFSIVNGCFVVNFTARARLDSLFGSC